MTHAHSATVCECVYACICAMSDPLKSLTFDMTNQPWPVLEIILENDVCGRYVLNLVDSAIVKCVHVQAGPFAFACSVSNARDA